MDRSAAPTGRQSESAARAHTGRSTWLALLVLLLVAAWPVRDALLDPRGRQLLATDTATSQLPWSGYLAERGIDASVANAELSDQGVVFHPYYRWVIRSWLAGDPPLWNPHVYLGAPGLGNPQAGVLDPQVLALVVLEGALGEFGYRLGLALLAWLRLGLGAFGAFLLARRLGLFGAAPWIAGLAFGLSAFPVLWLGHPLGHVPVFLPWTLLAIEGLRGARPRASLVAIALTTAASIHAGHPETSFYCSALAGLWSLALLRDERRAGVFALVALLAGALLSGAVLVPFVEYLGLSLAKSIRASQQVAFGDLDPSVFAALVPLVGAALVWRASRRREPQRRAATRAIALVLGALGFVLSGLPRGAVLAFAPEIYGRPGGTSGYLGPGSYLEEASAFAPLAVYVLAAASAIAGGALRRRRLLLVSTAVAWWLALRAPGLLELKQQLPLVGLGATVRLAPVAALGLALLAGDGWQSTGRSVRLAALAAVLCVAAFIAWTPASGPRPDFDPSNSASDVALLVKPGDPVSGRLTGRRIDLEGWVRVGPGEQVFLILEHDGLAPQSGALELRDEPSERARQLLGDQQPPAGARWFSSPYLDASRLDAGWWSATITVLAADGVTQRVRATVACLDVQRERHVGAGLVLCIALALAVVFLGGPVGGVFFCVLLTLRLLLFAEDQNPATPIERVFPLTQAEEILREAPQGTRVFGDAGVLPPNTALVHGLWSVGGYDGMEPAAHATWVEFVLPAGAHQLLSWNARGIDVNSGLFALSGCTRLALAAPISAPGWELIAGPGPDAPRRAECWIYADTTPLPRAFCVARVGEIRELAALLRSGTPFDPRSFASFESEWRPLSPFTTAEVGAPRFTNNTVELEAELDGDGLLVLCEIDFPGWRVLVDGEPRELAAADGVLRGVPLEAGRHHVRFEYAPNSLRSGLALVVVGLGLVALGFVALTRQSKGRPA